MGGVKLSELGVASKDEVSKKADEMIHTAKGERIAVGDSSDAFFEGLKLFGKSEQVQTKGYQLFDASKIPTKSAGGATVTNNGDGSFTISGSGNLSAEFTNVYQLTHEETTRFLKAGTLKITRSNIRPELFVGLHYDGRWSSHYVGSVSGTGELDITEELLQKSDFMMRLGFSEGIGIPIVPGTFKPMVYQDGDGTWESFSDGKASPSMEYKQDPESAGDGGELEVKVKNSNLLGGEELAKKIVESGGTRSGNLVSFMCEKSQKSILFSDFEDDAEYTLILYGMCKNIQSSTTNISVTYNDDLSSGYAGRFTKKGEFSYCVHKIRSGAKRLLISWDSFGTDIDITKSGLFKGQVDLSDFIKSNTQTFSPQTPNGLQGLPVDSGGNYTDESGQQWVCDEMDFKRGKYVQRIKKVVFNGSEDWNLESISQKGFANFYVRNLSGIRAYSNVLSNQFRNQTTVISETTEEGIANLSTLYVRIDKTKADNANKFKEILKTNNLEICYQLATPIETDIPEETMTAYRNLYTNYPSTVIQNDSGAGMEVEYSSYSQRANKKDVEYLEKMIQSTQSSIANLLSLMPLEIQAAMIENDTNNLLYTLNLESEETV